MDQLELTLKDVCKLGKKQVTGNALYKCILLKLCVCLCVCVYMGIKVLEGHKQQFSI